MRLTLTPEELELVRAAVETSADRLLAYAQTCKQMRDDHGAALYRADRRRLLDVLHRMDGRR